MSSRRNLNPMILQRMCKINPKILPIMITALGCGKGWNSEEIAKINKDEKANRVKNCTSENL